MTVLVPEGRGLLDTHAFLWWVNEPERLSARAHDFIAQNANQIFFSSVTAWEISVKYAKGNLELPLPAEEFVLSRIGREGFLALPIEVSHALHVGHLPSIHADPFDRMLVSQAQLEGLPILTSDPNIARYDVQVIW